MDSAFEEFLVFKYGGWEVCDELFYLLVEWVEFLVKVFCLWRVFAKFEVDRFENLEGVVDYVDLWLLEVFFAYSDYVEHELWELAFLDLADVGP